MAKSKTDRLIDAMNESYQLPCPISSWFGIKITREGLISTCNALHSHTGVVTLVSRIGPCCDGCNTRRQIKRQEELDRGGSGLGIEIQPPEGVEYFTEEELAELRALYKKQNRRSYENDRGWWLYGPKYHYDMGDEE